jgi:hypothetical protein
MIALLLASTLAFADQATFDKAADTAEDAVGTADFRLALRLAKRQCASGIDCARLVEIQRLDREQRAWLEANPPPLLPSPSQGEGQGEVFAAAETVAEEIVEEEYYGGMAYFPPTFLVDQPTGSEYMAWRTPMPAPLAGVEVQGIIGDFPGTDLVCLRKDGLDIPMGPEVPFADSAQKGTPVQGCRAMHLDIGQSVWVPEGTTIQMATFDVTRQAYVIKHVYVCNKSSLATERIEKKSAYSCSAVIR